MIDQLIIEIVTAVLGAIVTAILYWLISTLFPTKPLLIERDFVFDNNEQIVQARLKSYFLQSQYDLQAASTNHWRLDRKSDKDPYQKISPKSWNVKVVVDINAISSLQTAVIARFKVDTTGQTVLKRERDYWEAEANMFMTYIRYGNDADLKTLRTIERKAQQQNIFLSIAMVILMIVLLFLAAYVTTQLSFSPLVLVLCLGEALIIPFLFVPFCAKYLGF